MKQFIQDFLWSARQDIVKTKDAKEISLNSIIAAFKLALHMRKFDRQRHKP